MKKDAIQEKSAPGLIKGIPTSPNKRGFLNNHEID
jgi:hypothetical protein